MPELRFEFSEAGARRLAASPLVPTLRGLGLRWSGSTVTLPFRRDSGTLAEAVAGLAVEMERWSGRGLESIRVPSGWDDLVPRIGEQLRRRDWAITTYVDTTLDRAPATLS